MNLINKLADLVGFHQSYLDCFGNTINADQQAKYSLLKAMGYDVDSEQTLQKNITELSENCWRKILPPVYIANEEDDNHTIIISLPTSEVNYISWQIVTELGEKFEKNTPIAELAVVEEVTLINESFCKYSLPLPTMVQGYHKFTITFGEHKEQCHLIFAPKTCYSPQEVSTNKMWGYAAQLYSLKSNNNWGMGDFGDLKQLVKLSAKQHASVIGLNPLHPLYQNNPAHRSPYSPTSRCFLNALYIDVSQIPNFSSCAQAQQKFHSADFQKKINYARDCQVIDYPAVADVKFEIIEILYQDFTSNKQEQKLIDELAQFIEQGGEELQRLATFEALYEHFRKLDCNACGWKTWPTAYQQPNSAEVIKFTKEHSNRVDYFCFVQWLAHRQLTDVSELTKQENMPIGLYLDLAVGCDGSGVDVWSEQNVYVSGASVGAPPRMQ